MRKAFGFVSLALVLAGCAGDDRDIASDTFAAIAEGSPEAAAVLALVNDPAVDQALLDDEVGLDKRAATNIIEHRDGADTLVGTSDDDLFDTIAELDGISYVGQSALGKLLAYAQANGYGPGADPGDGPTEAQINAGVLALVNDPTVDQPLLDDDVGLDKRAATNIIVHRDGPDTLVGTADDDLFDDIPELDDISYVGEAALQLLRDYAIANGYVETAPPATQGRPDLTSPVQYENPWCTYADSPPYVASVNWAHPDVQAAMAALTPGFRSTFSYSEWRVAYGLESENVSTEADEAIAKARNFMRVLCGEHRDYPDMIGDKLAVIGQHTHAAGPNEMTPVNDPDHLFDHLTYPAYVKLVNVMRAMHTARSQAGSLDGYHYGFQQFGHGSRRVDNAVAPMTHCEMRFVFDHYLVAGAPSSVIPSQYEAAYATYAQNQCTNDDFAWMYNFRGHVNFQPLWLESNSFIHNSRRARGAQISTDAYDSYLRPFATRHQKAKELLASYLFHPDADHPAMIQASESGGGPILYVTDRDQDGDGLADYRLFNQLGCGDQGVGLAVPSQNCNMVGWTTAWNTADTTGHSASWNPLWWESPDMGFMSAFTTFQQRMSRFNQALDRHTNWGPTGYYMLEASTPGDTSPRFYGAYSPFVAASYDVSASDFFVRRDYPSTDSFEQGRAKWLFVMRFPTAAYYDAANLAAGKPIDFDSQYFNETALSNDYYDERALDHFGYVEGAEMHAQVYLTYGHRGENPPAPLTVPAP